MGQGSKTNKASESVAKKIASDEAVSARDIALRARQRAEEAAAEAELAQRAAKLGVGGGETRDALAAQKASADGATARMKEAATFAYAKAIAEGETKEQAKVRTRCNALPIQTRCSRTLSGHFLRRRLPVQLGR